MIYLKAKAINELIKSARKLTEFPAHLELVNSYGLLSIASSVITSYVFSVTMISKVVLPRLDPGFI